MSSRYTANPKCGDCGRKKGPKQVHNLRCATCQRIENRKASQRSHEKHILETYGLTVEEYHSLLAFQGGKCGICMRASGRTRRLAVDHDHSCEMGHPPAVGCKSCIRGLLCGTCNVFIGRMRDDPRAGDRMARYLRQPPWRALQLPTRGQLETAQMVLDMSAMRASEGEALAVAFRRLIREVPTAHIVMIRVEGVQREHRDSPAV